MARVTVQVPTPLRELVDGRQELEVEASSVEEALKRISEEEPLLGGRLFADDGHVRGFVNLYLDGRDVRGLDEVERRIDDPAVLTIVPSIAGGSDEGGGRPTELTPEEALRYHRQLILPGIGVEGQKRLRESGVLVAGAGGLGSPAALYLAAAGVGRIGIVDSDRVELSNLHRQILHDTPSTGVPKAESALQRLGSLNPDVEIVALEARLDSGNALSILSGWDLVLDGSDNFPTRYLINDACVLLGIPCVFGAVFRYEGQASVFAHREGPCYRCLFRDPPPPEMVPSCAEAGVLGVLPGLVGTIQATEAMKLILGIGEPLVGRLLLVDARSMEFRAVDVSRDPECAVCGDNPSITRLIDYEEFCGVRGEAAGTESVLPPVPEIDVAELKARLDTGQRLELLDVRETHEWSISNLGFAGARLIPLGQLFSHVDELDPEAELVVYCRTGHRSAIAVGMLRNAGIGGAVNLRGGINEWALRIDPGMTTY
jgi:adenylyltransferase/sulfurtransferase